MEKLIEVQKEYIKKIIREGKPYCKICLDNRSAISQNGLCEDCIYMNNLLTEIKI
jgi:hypothetical protein